MFKTVIFNTGAQIIGKIITASATLLVTILIGHALGEAGYGEFTKIFVFVGYFYALSDFGLNAIYVKLADSQNQLILLRSLLGMRLILSFTLAVIAILISFIIPYNPAAGTGFSPLVKTGIVLASLTIVTQSLFTTANAFFQKNLRYDLSAIAAVVGTIVILLGVLTATFQKWGIFGYTSAYVFGGVTFVLVAFYLIFKKTKEVTLPNFSSIFAKNFLKSSWPIGTALVLNILYFRVDIFIMANTRPSAEVGLYGLAYQFFEAALAIPIFFANSLYPLLSKLHEVDFAKYKTQLKLWLKFLLAASIFLFIALSTVAAFIPVIYQGRFTGSVLALQILAVGMPFFFISALLWHVLIIYGKQKSLIYIYGAGAVFNLITNLIFIPSYGYIAASITTVVSEAIITALLALVLFKYPK